MPVSVTKRDLVKRNTSQEGVFCPGILSLVSKALIDTLLLLQLIDIQINPSTLCQQESTYEMRVIFVIEAPMPRSGKLVQNTTNIRTVDMFFDS